MVKHRLVPQHELLSPQEAQRILDKYKVSRDQMPKITVTDPAVRHLKVQVGDIIQITRESKEVGKSLYYRVVVE